MDASCIKKERALNKALRTRLFLFLLLLGVQIVRVTLFTRRRDPNAFSSIDIYNIFSIIIVLILLFFLVSDPLCRKTVKRTLGSPLRFFYYYYFFCLIAALWSSQLVFGIYRAVELMVVLLSVSAVMQFARRRKLALTILLSFVLLSSLSGIGVYWMRGFYFNTHTNSFTVPAAMGLVFAVYMFQNYKVYPRKYIILFGGCNLMFLVLGTSSASNVAALVGVVLVTVVGKRQNVSLWKILFVASLCFVASNYFISILFEYVFPNKDVAAVTTMTGRTGMWKIYWQGFLQKPILGWGFPSGEKEAVKFGWVVTSSSHNAVISILVNTGIVGGGIALLSAISFFKVGLVAIKRRLQGAWGLLCVVIVGVINSMSYPMLGSEWNYPTSSFFMFAAYSVFYSWSESTKLKRPRRYYC